MQELVTCYNAICEVFGPEMNLKKTEVMLLVPSGKEYMKPTVFVGNKEVNVGKFYTYLGSKMTMLL